MKDYNFYLGSLTDHLLDRNISNEDIMSILLDFKVIWSFLEESDALSKANIYESFSEVLQEYSHNKRMAVTPWLFVNIISKQIDSHVYIN